MLINPRVKLVWLSQPDRCSKYLIWKNQVVLLLLCQPYIPESFQQILGISWEYTGILFSKASRHPKGIDLWFLGNLEPCFFTQGDCGLGTVDCESVIKKLSDIRNDYRGTYNTFKDEDCYVIGKYALIHRTASHRKIKKSRPYYTLTESTVRTVCDKYHWIVKSCPTAKTITSLKRGRQLMLRDFCWLMFEMSCIEHRRSCCISISTKRSPECIM